MHFCPKYKLGLEDCGALSGDFALEQTPAVLSVKEQTFIQTCIANSKMRFKPHSNLVVFIPYWRHLCARVCESADAGCSEL